MTEDLRATLSPKVVAGTAGAGAGAIVTTAVTWAVGAGWFGAGWDAGQVGTALDAVPWPLAALLALGIGVGFTFIPAWWIRDHVREEGAAVIAAQPSVAEIVTTAAAGDSAHDASLEGTAAEIQEVLDRHLASTATQRYGSTAEQERPDYVTEDTDDTPPARGL